MESYDVVVVGGGPAGLAGAVALARSRRSVLVVDAGEPRNAPAAGAHNLLGREGVSPLDLLATGRAEAASYGATVRAGRALGAERVGHRLVVRLEDGTSVAGRRLLVTTGLTDQLPEVPGLREHWGREVLHCPYCHGWEVRDQRIGVLATTPAGVHQALLFSQLSDQVTLLTHSAPPGEEDGARLAAAGVEVREATVLALEDEPQLGARLDDGSLLPLDALVVAPRMLARSAVLDDLGLAPEEHVSGMGEHYPSEPVGRTAVPGVWLAGNVTDLVAQVGGAAAAGTMAGAGINMDLIEEDVRGRSERPRWDADFWDQRYSSSEQIWSGHVNAVLAAVAGTLEPGRALDVGCGEGGDALWLAEHGWEVTGVDVSQVAIDRAARQAGARGLAERTDWEQVDLRAWRPGEASYDLVSAAFIHMTESERRPAYAGLAAAVRPGGSLLVLAHHPSDAEVVPRPPYPDLFFTAEDLVADLRRDAPGTWEVLVAEARPRPTRHPESGAEVTVHDTVLHARRTK